LVYLGVKKFLTPKNQTKIATSPKSLKGELFAKQKFF
jgi:hypothetical protein